jgi:hypothetical protein
MTVTSGTLLDNLVAGGTYQGYTDTVCGGTVTTSDTFGNLNLMTGFPGYSFMSLFNNPHDDWQSRKLTALIVQTQIINSNPKDIVVGGHTYRIVGWEVCENN